MALSDMLVRCCMYSALHSDRCSVSTCRRHWLKQNKFTSILILAW